MLWKILISFCVSATVLGLLVNAQGEGRIIGGTDAAEGEFPHQIYVLWNYTYFVGAATIVSADWAVTCAHVVNYDFPISMLSVVSGTNSMTTGGTHHQVVEMVVHGGYNPDAFFDNDIALIRISPPFNLDGVTEAAVKLPTQDSEVPVSTPATIIGWGTISEEGIVFPENLQKATTLVSDKESCSQIYGAQNVTLTGSQICAIDPDQKVGPCAGDGGGPLLVNGEIIGMVSTGGDCTSVPSVFTKVSLFVDWITQIIAGK